MFIQAVLILHLLICLGLIGAILLQRSEGGGLGIGSSPGGAFGARGAADFLTFILQKKSGAIYQTVSW
jgi:preprotein translocase subunit SecG